MSEDNTLAKLALAHTALLPELLKAARSDADRGLTSLDAQIRLQRDGRNVLPRKGRVPWWNLLLRQFASPLVYILVVAAGITWWLNEVVDTVMIMAAVIVSVGVGFWQEYRAGDILESLRKVVRITARVVRDGKIHEVDSEELVVGDIIELRGGAKVPADARLLSLRNLEVDEAILTGESMPVQKEVTVLREDTPLADRKNIVHMGTIVSRGEGRAVVTATATRTAIGEIAVLTQEAEGGMTPLQERLNDLGKLLTWLVLIAGVIIIIVGYVEGHSLIEMFTTAVAVAIGSIPEGLPAALSIVLAVAMQKVLKHRGLVQSLLASETLGSVSVICTDKTGTLTEGRMRVEKVLPYGDYEQRLHEALALANEAVFTGDTAETDRDAAVVRGDPTDVAKMEAYLAHGGNIDDLLAHYPRRAMLRFDSSRKFLASFHRGDQINEFVYVSGAPEILLRRSSDVHDDEKARLLKQTEELAAQGYRVIAAAWQSLPLTDGEKKRTDEELEAATNDLSFLGLVALRDPIRKDVVETMRLVRSAGVRVVMITGDHRLTAAAIGRELGFSNEAQAIVEGAQLDKLSDLELEDRVERIEILARVTPRHKIRIVQAWQARGASVAMGGDGVNDAPALKAADIGVAVGSATDVTKTAADLVLLDNSFSTIVAAIREGRVAFDNIRKISVFLIADAMTEVVLVMAALIMRVPIPLTAVQILWINFVKDVPPALALSFEPGEENIMRRKPLPRKAEILDKRGKVLTVGVGVISNVTLLGIFLFYHFGGHFSLEYLRTLMFAGVGMNAVIYVFALKNLEGSVFKTNLLNNKILIWASLFGFVLMMAAIYPGLAHRFLETRSLALRHAILMMAVFPFIQLFLIEGLKWILRRKGGDDQIAVI